MSKVEKQRDDHADIMPTIEEAKVFAMAKVENQVHRMETLHKELAEAEAEAEFNELKGNEAHLDHNSMPKLVPPFRNTTLNSELLTRVIKST